MQCGDYINLAIGATRCTDDLGVHFINDEDEPVEKDQS